MSTMEKKDTLRIRRSFTEEFKADAVAMVLDEDRRIVDVAEAINVGEGTLGNWVRLEKIERGERAGLTRDDRAELAELRKTRTPVCGWNEIYSNERRPSG